VERDAHLLELSRYVVLSPVRARIVTDAAAWVWSSHRAMMGLEPPPPWLETDWILGQFGTERGRAPAQYSALVAQGVGQPSIWEGLRHQIFLGSEAFVARFSQGNRPLDKPREVSRAQRRPFAQSLGHYERAHPDHREAMARAFLTGVYTMQGIADHFGLHYSTVSRAVRWLEMLEQRRT
jgi:putative transposase